MLTDPPTKCSLWTNVFANGGEIIITNINIITNIKNRMKRRKAAAGHLTIDSVVQIGHLITMNNIIIINITDNTNNTNTITIIIAMAQNTVLRRLVIDCHILIGKLMPSRQKRRFPHASDLCLCQRIRIKRLSDEHLGFLTSIIFLMGLRSKCVPLMSINLDL